PAGCAGSGRAVATCLCAGAPAACGGRGADRDPGRRPPPLPPAGHRADHRGGAGVLKIPSSRRTPGTTTHGLAVFAGTLPRDLPHHKGWWLWVPASAGTTEYHSSRTLSSGSPLIASAARA